MEQAENRRKETSRRIITGIAIAIALFFIWYVQGWPMRIAFAIMMILSMHEMYCAFIHAGTKPARVSGMIYAVLAMPAYLVFGVSGMIALFALCVMIGLSCVILRGVVDFSAMQATIFPLIYPGLLFSLMFPLQDIQPPLLATIAIGLAFLIALANDVMGYAIGVRFGKTKLSPNLSPKKSVEGAVAGLAGSIFISVAVPVVASWITNVLPAAQGYRTQLPALWHFALMGLLGGVAGPIGDLTASLVKRHCGVKDYGALFPGHGGMLDRIDSVIFGAAAIYCYFALVLKVA